MKKAIFSSGIFLLGALTVAVFPDMAYAQATGGDCDGYTLGAMMCNIINSTSGTPGIISGGAYLMGLLLGVIGIKKLKDHVENPNHVPLSDSMKRFVAGGAFFSFPLVADVARDIIEGEGADVASTGVAGEVSGGGLDAMIVRLVGNIFEPTIWAIGWLGYIAGLIFVFIGISRLLKTEQQGPQGPTGLGTIGTFVIAGTLFSLNSIITFLNNTVFGGGPLLTSGVLAYGEGLGDASASHVTAVISGLVFFAMMVGWISIVRGLFIVRDVSEGKQQASMMAAITHLIGGILAVNLGGFITAVQRTLGIEVYGINFNGIGIGP